MSTTQTKHNVDVDHILHEVKTSPSDMIKLTAFDIDGVARGKYLHKTKFASAAKNGSAFCSVVFGWDCAGTSPSTTNMTLIKLNSSGKTIYTNHC